jgi:hypothetical protein
MHTIADLDGPVPHTHLAFRSDTCGGWQRIQAVISLSLLLLALAPDCVATSLSFVGTGSYNISGSSVVLRADQIENNEFGGISGTIRLELWAFSSPYPQTTFGYKLASYVVGQLSGGYYFYGVNSGSIPFSLPPPGTWSFSLQVREYVGGGGDGYVTRDYINFSSPVRVAGGAFVGDVEILGLTSWQVGGSSVSLYVEQIRNICDLGTSGSLRLDLWATTAPYTGSGPITGFRFASTALNPLTAGYVYDNINRTVTYFEPPDGTYYVTLTLAEFHNGEYLTIDYLNYGSRLVVGTVPSPPIANPATSVNATGFTATWSPVASATGYLLDVSTTSTFNSYLSGYQSRDLGNTLSRPVSGLVAGATYYYRVRAYNANGTSGNSGTIAVTLPCTYLVTTTSSGGGTTSGGGVKTCGASVAVVATPSSGFRFVNWTEAGNVVSTSATYTFAGSSDRTLVANFFDVQSPSVSISSPRTGTTYSNAQSVTIGATAADNVGVSAVEFYHGSSLAGVSTAPPYTHIWSFNLPDNGQHVWTARAYDAAGNRSTSGPVSLTVGIDVTPPTVTITNPTNGQVVTTRTITVTGTAIDPTFPSSGVVLVQVRVNGGSWSNATGTATWTRSVTLSPCQNTIEARCLDRAGNDSGIRSVTVTYPGANTAPARPANSFPPDGEVNVSLTPTLQATPFLDLDCVADTHAASRWQVLSGSTIVADSGTNVFSLTSWTVPANKLYFGSNYQWRVRYRDNRNGWSTNSIATRFTTIGPPLTGVTMGTNMVLTWPTNARGFRLQWSTNAAVGNWSNAASPVIASGKYTITNKMDKGRSFYRLRR